MFKPIVEYLLCILLFVTADLFPQILPLPSGTFAVGRASYDWIDSSRAEGFSSQAGIKRELMVYVWYPARVEMSSRAAEYIPAFDRIERALGEGIMKDQFGEALGAIKSGQLCPHASVCVPLAVLGAPYPVLVFSHGFGETVLFIPQS